MSAFATIRCTAGPDAGWVVELCPGFHWIGRAAGGIELSDPAVEAHQAIVEIEDAGTIALLQTTGRTPIRIGGEPVGRGWHRVVPPIAIEIGHSRLAVGTELPAIGTSEWAYIPMSGDADELDRFARDVVAAAGRRRTRARLVSQVPVVLGEGGTVTEIELRDRAGHRIAPGTLSAPALAVLDRTLAGAAPVEIDLSDHPTLAVVAPDPDVVAAAIVDQLTPIARARLVIVEATVADRFVAVGRPPLVLATDPDEVPPWCRSRLDVGTTWRGTWTPDTTAPATTVRLHARGRPIGVAIPVPACWTGPGASPRTSEDPCPGTSEDPAGRMPSTGDAEVAQVGRSSLRR